MKKNNLILYASLLVFGLVAPFIFPAFKVQLSIIFKWFNCIAYSVLAALIARMVVFPAGELAESAIFIRLFVVVVSVVMFLFTKRNLVYPTVASAIMLAILNNYLSI